MPYNNKKTCRAVACAIAGALVLCIAAPVHALSFGDSGADVIRLQKNLQRLGYMDPKADTDGIYGLSTEGAVRDFRQDNSLDAQGGADDQVIQMIESALSDIDSGESQSVVINETMSGQESPDMETESVTSMIIVPDSNVNEQSGSHPVRDAVTAYLKGRVSITGLRDLLRQIRLAVKSRAPERRMNLSSMLATAADIGSGSTGKRVIPEKLGEIITLKSVESQADQVPFKSNNGKATATKAVTQGSQDITSRQTVSGFDINAAAIARAQSAQSVYEPAAFSYSGMEAEIEHIHEWVPVYTTVHHEALTHEETVYENIKHEAEMHMEPVYHVIHHDALTHEEPVYVSIHHEAETHEEPVYEDVWHEGVTEQGEIIGYARVDVTCYQCSTCGSIFNTEDEAIAHVEASAVYDEEGNFVSGCDGYSTTVKSSADLSQPIYEQIEKTGYWEKVQTGTTTVVDKEAWDEEVLDHYETVVDKEAYDEKILNYYKAVIDKPAWEEQGAAAIKTVVDCEAYDEEVIDHFDCSGCGATSADGVFVQ